MPVFLELNNRNRGDSEQEMNTHVNKSNIKFLMLYNNICVVTNKSEVGSPKSEVRSPKSEVRSRKSEVRSPKIDYQVSTLDFALPTYHLFFNPVNV
jgi:hypothetical protein